MKRYLLFAWDQYYPSGGMNDLKGEFDTEQEAKGYAINSSCAMYDHIELYDTQEGTTEVLKH